ncbi:type III PLP-dependent enzyme domain-containing protein [Spelaeicoccus albus]|uniref:Diaminopimelate decarboxylase n=1 Tax=Spelaeicoccus albus TaxID=1280376 RepID=A0A7Z0IIS8_9MICO|nr:diaminopimelate decarboxylase [Spelaeicoccus albus]NYI68810.1 diaminopimelate decarboxylase [Spelaeicoccus albus]
MKQPKRQEQILRHAIGAELLHPENAPIASFLDWDGVEQNVQQLMAAFPSDIPVLHAFAAKANSLVPVLLKLGTFGMGAEVASSGELSAALAGQIDPARIVFDSPAKSWDELRRAMRLGIAINVDNFQELARVSHLREIQASQSQIGVRINPQVGAGSIPAMSTASAHSKFGVPLRDPGMRQKLLDAYTSRPWLRRAHAHVGSQGCSLKLIADGIAALVEFADEVNSRAGRGQVSTIDIGGGLPVDFDSDLPNASFAEYTDLLKDRVPRLFSGDYSIVTEFGRSILAKHGMIVAYVEYTKTVGGRKIAITHAGAQVATRTVFMPEAWPLRIRAYDPSGEPKPNDCHEVQDVAGPCCFAGDLVAQGRHLPLLEPGDLVVLLDTGAYYASTPFDYNSLPLSGVYGVENLSSNLRSTVLREPQWNPIADPHMSKIQDLAG